MFSLQKKACFQLLIEEHFNNILMTDFYIPLQKTPLPEPVKSSSFLAIKTQQSRSYSAPKVIQETEEFEESEMFDSEHKQKVSCPLTRVGFLRAIR